MDNMNNTQTSEPKENNKKLIIISSIVIVALIAVFVVLGFSLNWFGGKKDASKTEDKTAPTIAVLETKGAESKTTKVKIKVRDVKFGDKVKEVKKFEKKQDDTLDGPSEASTKDGYTYLTYNFNTKNAKFYGVKPKDAASAGLLQYVFKKKKLFDIRIQFGDISPKERAKVEKTVKKKFGKPTFFMKYSDKSYFYRWRTDEKDPDKQTILSLNYAPNSGMSIDYQSVKR